MIDLARSIDAPARAVRKVIEAEGETKKQAYAQVAKAKFAIEGSNGYPDATFTLRLAYGVVKGYEENGKPIPFETDFAGLYQRSAEHHNQAPFDLPERWVKQKDKLDLKTPLNFVCTADIVGGNSGSPVVNRKGEFVGIIFDGNIQSLVLDFVFTETQAAPGGAFAGHRGGTTEGVWRRQTGGGVDGEIVVSPPPSGRRVDQRATPRAAAKQDTHMLPQSIHGLLALDKPAGITSREAVDRRCAVPAGHARRPYRHPRPAGHRRPGPLSRLGDAPDRIRAGHGQDLPRRPPPRRPQRHG